MPLCRCMGEVIVLSGLIFLMKGLWAGFSEHWLAGSIAAWLAAAGLGCPVHCGEQTLPAIIIRTAALCGRVRF